MPGLGSPRQPAAGGLDSRPLSPALSMALLQTQPLLAVTVTQVWVQLGACMPPCTRGTAGSRDCRILPQHPHPHASPSSLLH